MAALIFLMRELEHLRVDAQRFLNEMGEEATRDPLRKYRKKGLDPRLGTASDTRI